MLIVRILGSGSGLPTARRDTTSLLVTSGPGRWLVDCPGSIVHKLARLEIPAAGIRDVVLTHDHVDHIYGLPHLVHALVAVAGSCEPLTVHAPETTTRTVARMLEAHGLVGDRYPRVRLRPVAMGHGSAVAEAHGCLVTSTPAEHSRDTLALRFETSSAIAVHSSDTRPSDAIVDLARGADLLLHDCAGLHRDREAFDAVHSSARQAGEVASTAGVRALRLIHLSVSSSGDAEPLVAEASRRFAGDVAVAEDGDSYEVG